MRTLQTWRITLLSFGDDNIKSRIAIWNKINCPTLKYTIDPLVIEV